MIPLLLPILDVASVIYAAPSGWTLATAGGIAKGAADLLSIAMYWGGLYLLARLVGLRVSQMPQGVLRSSSTVGLFAVVMVVIYYHVLLWSFIAANGHAPSPEVLVFLADNVSRIPQHILQTSPTIAIGSVLVAGIAAFLVLKALVRAGSDSGGRNHVQAGQGLVLLVAWYVIGGAGAYRTPSYVMLDRDPVAATDARVKVAFESLPMRSTRAEATASVDGTRSPVIVILVESLRHDLLETNPEAIPFLRSLYQQQVGFSRAYATASHSNLSDLAFWYSQYPLRGSGREHFHRDADWRGQSLFDLFRSHSYKTAYISSQNERWGGMINWLDTDSVDYFFDSEDYQGETWENFDDLAGLGGLIKKGVIQAGKIEDSRTLEIAKQWIDSLHGNDAFFLGMNLQNTHFSYVLSPGAEQPFQPSELGFRAVYYRWPESERDRVRNRYLNSVLDVDKLLGDFADFLKARGLWDEALFVVLGDNGEAFYEHGFGNHSGPMYEEVVRTLAAIKLPASVSKGPLDVEAPISHIDIAATIPDIVGLPRPWSFQGRSVLSHDCPGRPVFMYSNALVRQFGIVSWPWKYLVTEHPDQSEELYDLVADPQESNNLLDDHGSQSASLRASLMHWVGLQRKYYAEKAYLDRLPPDYCSVPD